MTKSINQYTKKEFLLHYKRLVNKDNNRVIHKYWDKCIYANPIRMLFKE